MQRKRAFTLIELLVVIAIIAILAAILFPVFAKARERAKQSQSLNNVKQLSLGVLMYSQDYDQLFPGWVDNNSFGTGGGGTPVYAHNTWDEQINTQIKSKDVYNNGNTGIKSPSDPLRQRVLTYGFNGALIAPVTTAGSVNWTTSATTGPAIQSTGSVTNPSETILFAELATDAPIATPSGAANPQPYTGAHPTGTASDAWNSAQAGGVIDISPYDWVAQGSKASDWYTPSSTNFANYATKGVARDLYGGGGSYGFVDGHVKFLKIEQTVGLGQYIGTAKVNETNCWNPLITYNQWYPSR
jgi:prepilin-type N-terminal cleavage/methylation domain-containing protein/prepilin-type processing-associated H-X9-DG protein